MGSISDNSAARDVVGSLAKICDRPCGLGSMSCSVYDTAWLSMVTRDIDGSKTWVFPECFEFILDAQLPDGGWESYASQIDGILNTSAALLALLKKQTVQPDWDAGNRISRARGSLGSQLQKWDVDTCDHVGFEYLVPALLRMLAAHSVEFTYPGKQRLLEINAIKMAKFKPEMFYAKVQTAALHCVEAFADVLDFNKIEHHKSRGSIMASPASTAAYLMYRTGWDAEAEEYLRSTIANGAGKGNGSVAPAFPTTIFEITWVLSTLLKAGFTAQELGQTDVERLSKVISHELEAEKGVVGWAPGLLPDADDTAKSILTLNLLDVDANPEGMIAYFEGESHFRTYSLERNPSLSANCNVLDSLLYTKDPARYTKEIVKTVKFLADLWWNGNVADKWNLSVQYPMMLLAQAFRKVLVLFDQGKLPDIPSDFIRDTVLLTVFQIITRTLSRQQEDGSWGDTSSCEETAYGVLTLTDSVLFTWTGPLDQRISTAIELGQRFLQSSQDKWGMGTYTWIEKVTYKSDVLSTVYCAAACRAATTKSFSSTFDFSRLASDYNSETVVQFVKFFTRLPVFKGIPSWRIEAAVLEGVLHGPKLLNVARQVFPDCSLEGDSETYLVYVPFTWIGPNAKHGYPWEPVLQWDLMVAAMLNYQADAFIENLDLEDPASQESAHDIINDLLRPLVTNGKAKTNGALVVANDQKHVQDVLSRFVNALMQHPNIVNSNAVAKKHTRNKLREYLHTQLQHTVDNYVLRQAQAQAGSRIKTMPYEGSFYEWLHNVSSPNVSCTYTFTWMICRISNLTYALPTPMTQYLADEVTRHLSGMCRMYNDHGSVARDVEEDNVNSVNFVEFEVVGKGDGEAEEILMKKKALMEIAEYEREVFQQAQRRLTGLLTERAKGGVNVYVDTVDLYGQIYIAKDLTQRVRV